MQIPADSFYFGFCYLFFHIQLLLEREIDNLIYSAATALGNVQVPSRISCLGRYILTI